MPEVSGETSRNNVSGACEQPMAIADRVMIIARLIIAEKGVVNCAIVTSIQDNKKSRPALTGRLFLIGDLIQRILYEGSVSPQFILINW
jgi:hypothetical protein